MKKAKTFQVSISIPPLLSLCFQRGYIPTCFECKTKAFKIKVYLQIQSIRHCKIPKFGKDEAQAEIIVTV